MTASKVTWLVQMRKGDKEKMKYKNQHKSTFSQSFSVNLLWSLVLCWDLRFLSMEAIMEQTCSEKREQVGYIANVYSTQRNTLLRLHT